MGHIHSPSSLTVSILLVGGSSSLVVIAGVACSAVGCTRVAISALGVVASISRAVLTIAHLLLATSPSLLACVVAAICPSSVSSSLAKLTIILTTVSTRCSIT